ncbi:type IIL restriction-modification enzyme MmeI [Lactobacillus sp. HT06-2]|uniref:type IIL restriction-modification enzyme MmeI n=1 Tax=Lactobacillus sp. HT06-2 TaxID=2080222 RepID=UPI0011AECB78|nr:type IIL restriction-modification enzyme MmeI [Lactobacillus sp. HT06-2]
MLYEESTYKKVNNINAYLLDAPNILLKSISNPLCAIPKMTTGNRPADGGHLIIEKDQFQEFIKKEPKDQKWIKRLMGAREYLHNEDRYCLWLVGITPKELHQMPLVLQRVEECKEDRINGAKDRQKLAETPWLFREQKNPSNYLIVPNTSSERRRYIPIGYLDQNTIPSNSATIIPNATLYELGILSSNMHMAWMRTVAGRLEMRYRYSAKIVYNNFPWPNPTDKQKTKIEKTAQAILDARALYPDSSLADLYDPLTMPKELLKAHQDNDRAVMEAYGLPVKGTTESDAVAHLFKMYEKLTADKG